MSVKVTTWVWEHSASRGPARLVLLAIADNAHDDGAQAWPSMTTLVRKTGLGERTVHRAIKQLTGMGELEVDYNAGPKLCNLYRVCMPPAPAAPPSERHPRQSGTPVSDAGVPERHPTPVRAAPQGVPERHPEPSVEPSRNRQVGTPLSLVPSDADVLGPAHVIFDAWVASFPDATRRDLTPARRDAIKAALARYPLEDVTDAARGWVNDPWPERAQQNDLAQLLHMGSKRKPQNVLEKMRDLWRHPPPAAAGRANEPAGWANLRRLNAGELHP